MSIWTRIGQALRALREGEPLSAVFDALRSPPEHSVAFTIAVIALGAKLAKADGEVTRNEVRAFREVFHIPPADEAAAARVFNLAREDVAGFEDYARRIARMFAGQPQVLADLLEGLFHIAVADGAYHEAEDLFLERVAALFGLEARVFSRIRGRLVPGAEEDPWDVLGVTPETPLAQIRARWRAELKESHPDVLIGRGLPVEAQRLAEKRLIAVNRAWEQIRARTGGAAEDGGAAVVGAAAGGSSRPGPQPAAEAADPGGPRAGAGARGTAQTLAGPQPEDARGAAFPAASAGASAQAASGATVGRAATAATLEAGAGADTAGASVNIATQEPAAMAFKSSGASAAPVGEAASVAGLGEAAPAGPAAHAAGDRTWPDPGQDAGAPA